MSSFKETAIESYEFMKAVHLKFIKILELMHGLNEITAKNNGTHYYCCSPGLLDSNNVSISFDGKEVSFKYKDATIFEVLMDTTVKLCFSASEHVLQNKMNVEFLYMHFISHFSFPRSKHNYIIGPNSYYLSPSVVHGFEELSFKKLKKKSDDEVFNEMLEGTDVLHKYMISAMNGYNSTLMFCNSLRRCNYTEMKQIFCTAENEIIKRIKSISTGIVNSPEFSNEYISTTLR